MQNAVKKMNDFYSHTPNANIVQLEFGHFGLDRWKREGYITDKTDLDELFGYDKPVCHRIEKLGGCEAALCPAFEDKVLEDRGSYEVVQDFAGRKLLCFKGRRSGFMPEYIDHPIKDFKTWEEFKWRMNPDSPERYENFDEFVTHIKTLKIQGVHITEQVVGGYMYLRSLIGPTELLFMFYDNPDLIHDCMKTWLELADAVIAKHQQHFTIDELFLMEDICYNGGSLISPDMIKEFLFPYYQQLISNIKSRQPHAPFVIQIDTDGDCRPVIPLYQSLGMTYMSPFEVASGCDVVEIRKQYPQLLIRGGIDKRILAQSKDDISREIERIMPFMKSQGGYIPCCDHGVPEEVSFANYMHYRNLMRQF